MCSAKFTSFSQCDNGVSTDPSNATNNELPDDASSGAPYTQDNRYLNGLDWWTPSAYTLDNMEFNLGQPYGPMNNIQPSSVAPYYEYLQKSSSSGIAAGQFRAENYKNA